MNEHDYIRELLCVEIKPMQQTIIINYTKKMAQLEKSYEELEKTYEELKQDVIRFTEFLVNYCEVDTYIPSKELQNEYDELNCKFSNMLYDKLSKVGK